MKCSGCGFNTFDYLDSCNKCGTIFKSNSKFKELYRKYSQPRKKSRFLKSQGPDTTQIIRPNAALNANPKNSNKGGYLNTKSNKSVEEYVDNISTNEPGLTRSHTGYMFEPDFDYDENRIYVQASTESRIAAFFIDFGILNILSVICICSALLISGYKIDNRLLNIKEQIVLIYLLLMFLSTSYFVLMQGFGGRTIGKLLLSLKVIKKDGLELGFMDSFLRFIGYFISIIPAFMGIIWSYIDANSQAWHDKIAGTVVIEK